MWCGTSPTQLIPPGPITSTKASYLALLLSPGSHPPPPGTSLQLTLPISGFSAFLSVSLHIVKGAYQVPDPGLSPAIMSGWAAGLAAQLPTSLPSPTPQ